MFTQISFMQSDLWTQLFINISAWDLLYSLFLVSWQMQSLFLPVVFISSPVLSEPQYCVIFLLLLGKVVNCICYVPCCLWSGGEIGFHVGSLVLAVVCCSFCRSGPFSSNLVQLIIQLSLSHTDDRVQEEDSSVCLLTIYILLFSVSPTGTSSSSQSVCCV